MNPLAASSLVLVLAVVSTTGPQTAGIFATPGTKAGLKERGMTGGILVAERACFLVF